ncbi:cell division control protein 14, partial [Modicella reniformis]
GERYREGFEEGSDEERSQEGSEDGPNKHGVVAVHCKAGLGRTGTLLGVFLMRHFDMSARETLGFMRIMRPGSVVGPQQNWLEHNTIRIQGLFERRLFGKDDVRVSKRLAKLLIHPHVDYEQVFLKAIGEGIVSSTLLPDEDEEEEEDDDDEDDEDDEDEHVEYKGEADRGTTTTTANKEKEQDDNNSVNKEMLELVGPPSSIDLKEVVGEDEVAGESEGEGEDEADTQLDITTTGHDLSKQARVTEPQDRQGLLTKPSSGGLGTQCIDGQEYIIPVQPRKQYQYQHQHQQLQPSHRRANSQRREKGNGQDDTKETETDVVGSSAPGPALMSASTFGSSDSGSSSGSSNGGGGANASCTLTELAGGGGVSTTCRRDGNCNSGDRARGNNSSLPLWCADDDASGGSTKCTGKDTNDNNGYDMNNNDSSRKVLQLLNDSPSPPSLNDIAVGEWFGK